MDAAAHPVGRGTARVPRIQHVHSLRDQTDCEEGGRTDRHEPRPRAHELGGRRTHGPRDGDGDSRAGRGGVNKKGRSERTGPTIVVRLKPDTTRGPAEAGHYNATCGSWGP